MVKKTLSEQLAEIGGLEVGIRPCDFTRKSFRAEPIFFKDFTKQLFPNEDLSRLTPEELYYKFFLVGEEMSVERNPNNYRFRISQRRVMVERMYAYQAIVNTLDIIYKNLLNNKKKNGIKRFLK